MVPSRWFARSIVLVALSIVAYLPALQLPFIGDDYDHIPMARHLSATGWAGLLHNTDLRTRATYLFLRAGLDRTFGFHPAPFYAVNILLHALCVLLVSAACVWTPIGRSTAFWAAGFFAVYEGHQEAIMWLAAVHNLLVFLFGMAAWLCWVRWLGSRKWGWYAGALGAILVAALSSETFWVFVLLMLAVTVYERRKQGLSPALIGLAPVLALSAAYVIFMFVTRVGASSRLDDRFMITGTTWISVALRGIWALIFPQGLLLSLALLLFRRRTDRVVIGFGCLWILLGIAPHSFLTYMPRLASRHTYLASAGLALVVGAALHRLSKNISKAAFAAICAVVLLANVEILWVKKMAQFRERAEPTELLKAAALEARGAITVDCTPIPDLVVERALESVGAKAIFPRPESHAEHCFAIEYQGHDGNIVRVNRRIGRKHGVFY